MSLRIPGARIDEQDNADIEATAGALMRRLQQQQPRDVALRLELLDAVGLAGSSRDDTAHQSTRRAYYCAVLSVSPLGAEVMAPVVLASPDPLWRRQWDCRLIDFPWWLGNLSLRVEVVRVFEMSEPGTSTGTVVVGRAEISLPRRVRKKKEGRFQLLRCDRGKWVAQGTVSLVLELLPL